MHIDRLTSYRFPDDDQGREVIVVGDQGSPRPVVLLHELGGLSPPTIEYAAELADSGCVVHMPLVFGSVGQDSSAKGLIQVCWGRQLTLLLSDRRPGLAGWLADFTDHLGESSGHPAVVIGMCATGGVVFSVMMRDSVGGAVAAQPALPLRLPWNKQSNATLGTSTADVSASANAGKPFLAMRFGSDSICPAGRLARIAETFGDDATLAIPGKGHSTLVYDRDESARRRVLDLLDEVFGPEDPDTESLSG